MPKLWDATSRVREGEKQGRKKRHTVQMLMVGNFCGSFIKGLRRRQRRVEMSFRNEQRAVIRMSLVCDVNITIFIIIIISVFLVIHSLLLLTIHHLTFIHFLSIIIIIMLSLFLFLVHLSIKISSPSSSTASVTSSASSRELWPSAECGSGEVTSY